MDARAETIGQRLGDLERRAFAEIVDIGLEGQTQHATGSPWGRASIIAVARAMT